MIGVRSGPNETTARLGEGGPGEDDHATDIRLEREAQV